jgi:uncharacterized protein DUF4430
LPLAPATATTNANVTLKVHAQVTFPYNEPAFAAECTVSVPVGSDGGSVLDQAVGSNCIEAWESITFPCCGRLVTNITKEGSVDATNARNIVETKFLCGTLDQSLQSSILTSSWIFYINGAGAAVGIDGYQAADGDEIEFLYVVDDCTFARTLALSVAAHVDSPVLVGGTAATDPGDL